ncbi:MAG: hypothetical protein JNN15_12425 [Blastocatellia bacterium]|nr:hypothetical protein [Blastocatellia bacterium]
MKQLLYCLFLLISLFLIAPTGSSNLKVSTVTFEFDGMMGLFMGNPRKVSVGIIDAHHHTPELVVYKLIEDKRAGKNQTREIARFTERELKTTLTVSVDSVNNEVAANRKLERYFGLKGRENDSKDFGWTLDIENDLYGRRLKVKEKGFLGKIEFNTGLFYTYQISKEKYKFVATDGSDKVLTFRRQIGKPAARIDLDSNQEVLISGFSQELRLKAEAGINYLVTVHNLPPEDQANLNHFLMYYDIIDEDVTKYEPVVVKTTGTAGGVCPPRVFGSSPLN